MLAFNRDGAPRDGSKDKKLGIPRRDAKSLLVGVRTEVCPYVGLRKGYSTKLPLIRRWRCGARVVEEPGLRQPDSQRGSIQAATQLDPLDLTD